MIASSSANNIYHEALRYKRPQGAYPNYPTNMEELDLDDLAAYKEMLIAAQN